MAVETTARDLLAGMSLDFAAGDLTSVEVKLNQLAQLGGIKVDMQLVSLAPRRELRRSGPRLEMRGRSVA